MSTAASFNLLGLLSTFVGAGLGVFGVWVTPDQAVTLGVTRLAGTTREENLELPAVQNLLKQSKYAVAGFALIGVGTVLQAIGALL